MDVSQDLVWSVIPMVVTLLGLGAVVMLGFALLRSISH